MIDLGRRPVLGVNVSAVDYESAVATVIEAARLKRPLAVSSLAVHGVMTGALDPTHRFRLNRFDLLTPDGQPVRWALRLLYGLKLPDRVAGPDLMLRALSGAADAGLSVFLFGGTSDLLKALADRVSARFPTLTIAGMEPSAFRKLTSEEDHALDERIAASGADIVFVGLGCPRQEVFVFEHAASISRPMLAVGAAFDFHAGTIQRAPKWMQDASLEWLFRLGRDPRRLWKRYLLLNPLYACMLLGQMLGIEARSVRSPAQKPASPIRYG